MINISAKDVNFYYGSFHALKNITLGIERNTVTAFIGPSGCGKSTFLRLLNRMNDLIEGTRLSGEIRIDGEDIYGRDVEVVELRKKVGMVFQKPNPFPKTIYENVAYGLRVNGVRDRRLIDERVESSLKGARAVGRGERQTEEIGLRAVGRATAAPLHRAGAGRAAVDPADG